jgi:signal transduction histidine kinase
MGPFHAGDDSAVKRLGRAWWPLAHLMLSAVFVFLLWRSGYPAWRTAAVAVLGLGLALKNLAFSHMELPVQIMEEPPGSCPVHGTRMWLLGIVSQFCMVAITGGLHSPFVITCIAPLSGTLVAFGWSRQSKLALRIAVGSALLLVLLPAPWFGPAVQEPYFSRLVGLTLLSVALLHGAYLLAMSRALNASRCRAGRARDQMTQAALARAREMEQLSAQLSHELKNPLGAIKALVQLSRRDACDEKSRERLQVAESEVERMSCILQEYLSFSRPMDKLRREPLLLGALADEVVDLLSAQAAAAGVSIRRTGEAGLDADPRRLREALFNLVANALEATPRGGTVEVRISERKGTIHLEVRDSGRGMSGDVLARVGTPFFTTREQGTGLGVAMARAAFSQHGGSLDFASEEGRGTTASATLPLPLPSSSPSPEGRAVGAPAPG